jgi:hypothetical protein
MRSKILLLIILSLISGSYVFAQTLPVGLLDNVEDAYRRQQLLGKDSSNSSYMIRPMFMSDNKNFNLNNDSTFSVNQFRRLLYQNSKYKTEIYALPLVWQQQENTHHPYGWNDGSMIQANGYQTQFSAGVFVKVGPLTIQLRPEYVYAENKYFTAYNNVEINNQIDNPPRFGNGQYSKVSWGQSSIRLNAGPVSLGLSNENLWWGPGTRNSLLMSNTASGFKHLTLNTTRPVKTYIGSFEAQIVSGKLEQSGIPNYGRRAIVKPKDWTYFSGLIITYQPKWVPNFYLGAERTFIVNRSNMGNSFADYFPIFKAVEKSAYTNEDGTNADDAALRDQYISFIARYVFPKSGAELYFEYGRNDHSYNLRDGFVEPEHSRAYIAGFRKLVPLHKTDEFIQFGVEFTQLETPTTRYTRATPPWYIHRQVTDGYTNRGQILGAGIGTGSNLQSVDVNWVKGLKKIGLTFERLVNNNDDLYGIANGAADKSSFANRHWVDLSVAGNVAWTYKRFVLNSQLTYIRSLNYQYRWKPGLADDDFWNWDKQDANNFHIKVGLLYQL